MNEQVKKLTPKKTEWGKMPATMLRIVAKRALVELRLDQLKGFNADAELAAIEEIIENNEEY